MKTLLTKKQSEAIFLTMLIIGVIAMWFYIIYTGRPEENFGLQPILRSVIAAIVPKS